MSVQDALLNEEEEEEDEEEAPEKPQRVVSSSKTLFTQSEIKLIPNT